MSAGRGTLIAAWLLLNACAVDGARAQSAEELAFWQSVQQGNTPQEYQAYLNAFPNGRFVPLARARLGVPSAPPAPAAQQAMGAAWLRPVRSAVRLTDGITLDADLTALRTGSNHRIAVVPVGTPDEVGDTDAFVWESTPVEARRLHLTVPSGPPGQDEVRAYYIPQFASTYVVGARAPATVAAGVPGAAMARDLTREAQVLGPVRFEAAHRDRPLLVQAAFLRVRPRTEWNIGWFGPLAVEMPQQVVVISIGLPGAAADAYGSRGEMICVLDAAGSMLDRVAALQTGDPVLVRGIPTAWDVSSADPLVLRRCALAG